MEGPIVAAPAPVRRVSYGERLAQLVLALIVIAILVAVLRVVGIVFGPVLIALLLAYVLNNIIGWVASRGMSRTVATVVIAGAVLLGIAAFALLALPLLISEMSNAFRDLPQRASAALEQGRLFLVERLGVEPQQIEETLANFTTHARETLLAAAARVASSAASLLNAVLIPVFTFYFLRDWHRLVRLPLLVIPERYHARVTSRAAEMDRAVGGWVRGQLKVALALAIILAIGLQLVGVRLGFVIGLMAGLLNVIPYLGAAIGVLLAVVMVFVDGGGVVDFALMGGVFLLAQILETYVLTPKLVGESVGLSPVMVLIVLLVGGSLFGFVGVLLAIPAAAVGAVVLRDLLEAYRSSPFWNRGAPATAVVVAEAPPSPVLPDAAGLPQPATLSTPVATPPLAEAAPVEAAPAEAAPIEAAPVEAAVKPERAPE